MNNTIIKPIISEKSLQNVKKGKFTFQVVKLADKNSIRKDIEKQFNVHVMSISTAITKGKTQRVGARRIEVVKSSLKKAIVTLKAGEKIDLFEVGL